MNSLFDYDSYEKKLLNICDMDIPPIIFFSLNYQIKMLTNHVITTR